MPWESAFRTETFCCVFSLQSGTVICIMVLAALGITSLVNIIYFLVVTSTFNVHIVPFILAMAYLLVIGVGIALTFTGAYTESTFWMILGAVFTGIAILFYIIIAILSFFPDFYSATCISYRCPEHLWLQISYWRLKDDDESPSNSTDEGGGNLSDFGIHKFRQTMRVTTHKLPTTKTISHRRLRPKSGTRPFGFGKGKGRPHFVEEAEEEQEGDKEEFALSWRKFEEERAEDEDLEYCPDGDDAQNPGIFAFSLLNSLLFLIAYIAFQLYSLYGFLCFAAELSNEIFLY